MKKNARKIKPCFGYIVAFDYTHRNGETIRPITQETFTLQTRNSRCGIILNGKWRYFTPLEFERLQGFPDEWTKGQADIHRYQQIGNAVTVPLIEEILDRLITLRGNGYE